ncbi:MAG TPA: 5'-3'-deoxyribonucleotidase [Candidatus Nanoarchaeia archaeon]|nr:5'-3'-deoxyribonucleotidase [Candidatus Nanoarchaeia archaeon]
MIILVDLDDVLADFEKSFLDNWRKKHPDKLYVPLEERTTFKVHKQYPPELKPLVQEIYCAPGFYRNLPLIKGGKEAIQEMRQKEHDVFLCTSPLSSYENCVLEKYKWTEERLGEDWVQRLIITKDKALVRGDILIDDNPYPKGILIPTWEHIIYDFPYNRHVEGKRRITWQNWKEVLKL